MTLKMTHRRELDQVDYLRRETCKHCQPIPSFRSKIGNAPYCSHCNDDGYTDTLLKSATEPAASEAIPNGVYKESELIDRLGETYAKTDFTTGTATGDYAAVILPTANIAFPPKAEPPAKPDLQLLVIDLGGCRVIRVDEGRLPDALADKMAAKASDYGPYLTFQGVKQIQAAIDAMDTPPVPRIELDALDGRYELTYRRDGEIRTRGFHSTAYDALSQLAGKPLLIYEKGGTWTMLKGSTMFGDGSGIKIYRYTR